ncbi:MAG: universal stress protein [Actinobacteria bacterium]|nr:universal stress protein [Actinomycetota bacterium]
MTLGTTIVVPIANPSSIRRLLEMAAPIAAPDAGRVVPLTVLRPDADADERAHAWRGLADAEALGQELGISVRGRVIESSDVAKGVLEAMGELEATLVVMGWRGRSSTSNIFGVLIDTIVGRSAVPLAVVRLGTEPVRRIVLPVSADHLLPGGGRGLGLAAEIGRRLDAASPEPMTVLRTGPREVELPEEVERLADRVHHDPRRTDDAVGAFARPDDAVVAAVAPTVSGLRAATTHLAWSAPESTLVVAIDVGPTPQDGLASAVEGAGRPAPRQAEQPVGRTVRIVVTARMPDQSSTRADDLERVLRGAGATEHVMAWWPASDPHPHVRATVTVRASSVNAAMSAVMVAVHEAPAFRGAEISYDVDRASQL